MYLTLCSAEQVREFYEEFNATEESMEKGVENLKEWLEKQPHLPNVEDDEWLLNFLLRCKNSLEKAKKKLNDYYTTRTLMPEVFQDRDPCAEEIAKTFRHGMYVALPKLTPEGYRISIYRLYDSSINNIPDAESVMKCIQMCADMSLKRDKIRGMILVYDFKHISMNYIAMIFTIVRKVVILGTRTTPGRIHKVIIMNLISAAEPIVTIAKSLIKKELADRVQILKDHSTDLSEFLPKDLLPSDYGGTNEKSLAEMRDLYYEEFRTYREWFISDEKNKADLSKKPTNSQNNIDASTYGIEGSFRKICLD